MSIRVLSDEDYNKLCTWGMTACLPLLLGETMKNLIERMRQSNIACVKAWYGDPATDQIGPWESGQLRPARDSGDNRRLRL